MVELEPIWLKVG